MRPDRTIGLSRRAWLGAAVYAAACAALWPWPVVGLLHAESSAVIAIVGCLLAGAASARARWEGAAWVLGTLRHLALLLVPFALLTLSLLWRPNCGVVLGAGLFWLFTIPSVAFGAGVGAIVGRVVRRWAGALTVGLLVLVAVVPALWTLKTHPQLFVYNPVFGGVLGPIYDDELSIRAGLFVHRAVTLLWAVGLGLAATAVARRGRRTGRRAALGAAAVGAAVLLAYVFAGPLGMVQTAGGLESELPGLEVAGPIRLRYDPDETSGWRARRLAGDALYRYARLKADLDIEPAEPVRVYVYPDEDTKGRLIGSRRTSVTPVWLPTPQVHILDERADGDMGHEFAHVFAREFGGRWTGATTKVGLVEGLAVAFEAPDGLPSPAAQVRASLELAPEEGGLADPAWAVVGAMDPLGFWTGRAGVAYSTAGAFTRWLAETHGVGPLREVYSGASWERAYGAPLDTLAARWARDVAAAPDDSVARAYTAWRFAQPSLFEVPCPHHVPRHRRLAREADALRRDPTRALPLRMADAARIARAAWDAAPDSLTAAHLAAFWAELALARPGASNEQLGPVVVRELSPYADLQDAPVTLLRALGDAHLVGGDRRAADRAYERARLALPPTAALGGELLAQRARLRPAELRGLLRAVDSGTAAQAARGMGGGARTAVSRGLLWMQAEEPARAWAAMREARIGTPAVRLLAAQIAFRAGDAASANELAERAERAFRRGGRDALAELARDLRTRLRWTPPA